MPSGYVSSRKVIAINYLKFWFWVDFLSSIPYDNVLDLVSNESYSSTQLIRTVKVLRLLKMTRLLKIAKLKMVLE